MKKFSFFFFILLFSSAVTHSQVPIYDVDNASKIGVGIEANTDLGAQFRREIFRSYRLEISVDKKISNRSNIVVGFPFSTIRYHDVKNKISYFYPGQKKAENGFSNNFGIYAGVRNKISQYKNLRIFGEIDGGYQFNRDYLLLDDGQRFRKRAGGPFYRLRFMGEYRNLNHIVPFAALSYTRNNWRNYLMALYFTKNIDVKVGVRLYFANSNNKIKP